MPFFIAGTARTAPQSPARICRRGIHCHGHRGVQRDTAARREAPRLHAAGSFTGASSVHRSASRLAAPRQPRQPALSGMSAAADANGTRRPLPSGTSRADTRARIAPSQPMAVARRCGGGRAPVPGRVAPRCSAPRHPLPRERARAPAARRRVRAPLRRATAAPRRRRKPPHDAARVCTRRRVRERACCDLRHAASACAQQPRRGGEQGGGSGPWSPHSMSGKRARATVRSVRARAGVRARRRLTCSTCADLLYTPRGGARWASAHRFRARLAASARSRGLLPVGQSVG